MRLRLMVLASLSAAMASGGVLAAAPAFATGSAPPSATATTPAPTTPTTTQTCSTPPAPGTMTCLSLRRTDRPVTGMTAAAATVAGYGPADLRSAYKLQPATSTATVAIIDAYDDPAAEADLTVYRAQYGLPACTTANGCFRKLNQTGSTSPMPAGNTGWAGEISLDIDMVSAVCPTCHILLVEANSASSTDLFTAVKKAVALGAKYISLSWGGSEWGGTDASDAANLNYPGVAITASSGDGGTGSMYPATSQYVTAVGGTTLRTASTATTSRGWTETAWAGAGSGCSAYYAKPVWQTVTTGCAKRAESDVSAVADPNTGVAVYQTYGGSGWNIYGGTSVAAPIIASVYALAGIPAATSAPASFPYAHPTAFFDVTSGTNGSCTTVICKAAAGWDGPTGLGTPNGVIGFTAGSGGTSTLSVTNPGPQTGKVGTATSLALQASGGTGTTTAWSATGLPPGLTLTGATGGISGTPTTAGTYSVTATAARSGATASTTFSWTVAAASSCTAGQLLGNASLDTRSAAPWTATPNVVSPYNPTNLAHTGPGYAWLDGYGVAHTDSIGQTVTIPSGCKSATLTFWLAIGSADTTTTAHDILTVAAGSTPLATYSNINRGAYSLRTFNLAPFVGKTVTLTFTGVEDKSLATSFLIDDVALNVS
jgi:Putative Ig domain